MHFRGQRLQARDGIIYLNSVNFDHFYSLTIAHQVKLVYHCIGVIFEVPLDHTGKKNAKIPKYALYHWEQGKPKFVHCEVIA